MKSEWTYRPLGELVSFASGGTPSKKRDDYWGGTIPWISAKTLKTENIDTSDLFITEEGLKAGSKIAPKGSILLLTRGSGLFNGIPIARLVVFSISLVFVLKKLRVEANSEAERYTILTVTEEKTVTSEFLLSYILPLFAFDFTQWKSVALFLIFFLTLGFLCVKHETFTVNIVLEVFGYQFYRCDLEDEDGNGITWMIISRTDLKGCVGDSVYLRPLNNECRLNASTR